MKEYVVYKITNLINGKIYIGLTSNFENRKIGHKRDIKKDSTPLQKSMKKYGFENFNFEILEKFNSPEEMIAAEIDYILKLNSTNKSIGYNIKFGGEGGGQMQHDEESVLKRSKIIHKRGPAKCKKFKNVFGGKNGDSYYAQICHNRIKINGSVSRTEIEAAWEADCLIRKHSFDEFESYLNFPDGKTAELIKEQFATRKLVDAIKFVHYEIKLVSKNSKRFYVKGRDIKNKKDINISTGKFEKCKADLERFIKENKSIKSGRGSAIVMQRNFELLHGSIHGLYTEEELNEAIKNELGKFE